MSYCNQCKVELKDPYAVCPLCNCAVKKDGNERLKYPEVRQKKKKMQLAVRIYLASAIVLQGICFYLNKIMFTDWSWSLWTLSTLAAVYVGLRLGLANRTGYRSRTIGLTIFSTAYIVLMDYELGFLGWSVNYVLPAI